MTAATMSIGDFSRATQMSVKMLRHYHQIGLLAPFEVDPDTSYRTYSADQIPTAQVIRRFRELQMPLGRIRDVLHAPDPASRNALLASHLDALQASLAQTQTVVASLRNLLDAAPEKQSMQVTHRTVAATQAAAISQPIAIAEIELWVRGALGELRAALTAQDVLVAGPAAGIYGDDLFANEHGQATVFIPYVGHLDAVGRVQATVIPAAELATVIHHGPLSESDLAYGTLAAYVARHELGINGPIRECYTVAATDTPDSSAWRTEIGLPIFNTRHRA
jgi:DNA-binding transcriptional MerR regulator